MRNALVSPPSFFTNGLARGSSPNAHKAPSMPLNRTAPKLHPRIAFLIEAAHHAAVSDLRIDFDMYTGGAATVAPPACSGTNPRTPTESPYWPLDLRYTDTSPFLVE